MNEPFLILSRNSSLGARLAVVQNGTLLEYYEDEASAESMVGAVLLGRVERVLPDMNAAFIRLGLSQNGFLPLKEQESFHQAQGKAPLLSGSDVVVQVKKDEKGGKGAFVTRDVVLPGQYVLMMPMNRFIGVSKRIPDEPERERARELGAQIAGGRFGLIMRQAALHGRAEEAKSEAEDLYAQWRAILEKAAFQKSPATLFRPASSLETVLRDYAARHPCELCVDGEPPRALLQGVTVKRLSPLEAEAAWVAARVERQLDEALLRRVPLPTGGSLVIDEREALQTIDVNSGSSVVAPEGQSLALSQNLAAVPEIARQIRLRNLSGIILIDFIDMDTDAERERVIDAVRERILDDRVKTAPHGFTSLGLMELTRKRTRDTLRGLLSVECPACHDSGRVRRR